MFIFKFCLQPMNRNSSAYSRFHNVKMTIAFAYDIMSYRCKSAFRITFEVFPNTDNEAYQRFKTYICRLAYRPYPLLYHYNIATEFVNSERSLAESRGDKISPFALLWINFILFALKHLHPIDIHAVLYQHSRNLKTYRVIMTMTIYTHK